MDKFVFFGTRASFTLSVFDNLQRLNCLPGRIVIPEFPASQLKTDLELKVMPPVTQNRLVSHAKNLNIPVSYAPENRINELLECLTIENFDFLLVACWPYKISVQVCNAVKKAAMNIHPSLLPAYRGRDPVGQQIEHCAEHIGVSLHLLNDAFDAGDIIASIRLEQAPELERSYIENQAARLGVKLFLDACRNFGGIKWNPVPQKISGIDSGNAM